MVAAFTRDGSQIIGTSESVLATAGALPNSFSRQPDGSLDFEHEGGSEVFWDTMTTQESGGKPLFVDEEGREWTADEIILEGEPHPALAFWTDDGEAACAR